MLDNRVLLSISFLVSRVHGVISGSTIDCSVLNCKQTTINCASNTDCHIDCSNGICVNSTINCPENAMCYLNLGIGLQLIRINAQSSTYFELDTAGTSLVENMIVFCPQNGYAGDQNICRFKGDQYYDCDIYAEEGFRDIYFDAGQSLSNVVIHCGIGPLVTEYQCTAETDGSACSAYCNSDFLIATSTPSQTTTPTNIPTHTPTNIPTNIPINIPTKNPTTSPTDFTEKPTTSPTKIPTHTPTNIPTKKPTTSPTDFTEKPTTSPTNVPTNIPIKMPTNTSTTSPTYKPTISPTNKPTTSPQTSNITPTTTETRTPTPAVSISSTLVSVLSHYDGNESLIANLVLIGYLLIIILGVVAVICTLSAFKYHNHISLQGCDNPNYFSLWRCFINISDFYTDFIFCIVLYLSDNNDLFICGIIFVSVSHFLSILMGLYMVYLWRNDDYKSGYVKKYDYVIIGLTILSGFYSCICLLSSKLFHLQYSSLHLTLNDKYLIQRKRFFVHNVFENMPLMIIQIVALNKQSDINQVNEVTFIALAFGLFSIFQEILTFLSRVCAGTANKELNEMAVYKLDFISSQIKQHHLYSHKLTQNAISSCFAIQSYRIEIISIIPIVNGISCNVYVFLDDDELQIDNKMQDLNNKQNQFYIDCKMSLSQCWSIQFGEKDLKIISTKIDGSVIGVQLYNPPKVQLMNIMNPKEKSLRVADRIEIKRESFSESDQIEGIRGTADFVFESESSSEHQAMTDNGDCLH